MLLLELHFFATTLYFLTKRNFFDLEPTFIGFPPRKNERLIIPLFFFVVSLSFFENYNFGTLSVGPHLASQLPEKFMSNVKQSHFLYWCEKKTKNSGPESGVKNSKSQNLYFRSTLVIFDPGDHWHARVLILVRTQPFLRKGLKTDFEAEAVLSSYLGAFDPGDHD